MPKEGFCVSWQQHSGAVCAGLQELQQRSEFVDMTLAADGHLVRVHQVVVGLASPYLKELIRSAPTPQPVIFLNNVSHKVLCCILEYIYTGEVMVPADELRNFIQVGKTLHVKGLEDLLFEEETKAHIQDHVYVPQTTTISVTPTQQDIVIKHQNLNEHPKGLKREISMESAFRLPSPKKRNGNYEIVHDMYDVDEAVQDTQNEFDFTADDNVTEEVVETATADTSKSGDLKPKVMYCLSQKGSLQVILNRYMYNHHHTLKDGKQRWRCVENRTDSLKCQAHLTTYNDQIHARVNAHNHPVHDTRIMKKVRTKGVYSSLESAAQSRLPDEDLEIHSQEEIPDE